MKEDNDGDQSDAEVSKEENNELQVGFITKMRRKRRLNKCLSAGSNI